MSAVVALEDRAQAERDRLADELEQAARRLRRHTGTPVGVAAVIVVDGGRAIETMYSGRAYASMVGGCCILARRIEAAMYTEQVEPEPEPER